MPLLAEYIPENDGTGFAFEVRDLELLCALADLRIISARLTQPSEVAFDVRHEHGNTSSAEVFSQRLQRDRFSRAGGAGDQAVTVCQFRQQKDRFLRLSNED